MSKSLKKLIDINGLREFKNKTGSAYVQTGAVDQTVGGTKTFSKPVVGSVTGSSGSCTGNAATATTATTAKACTGNAATATKLATARSLWGNNFDGSAAITGAITGTPSIEFKPVATTVNHGGFLDFHYNQSAADYTSRIIESASGTLSINNVTITTEKVVTATTFNGALTGNVTGNCSGSSGSCTGNAATATKLQTARTINGTAFDGTANVTTASWGTARNISITDGTNTSTAVSVNGSANVSLNLPSTIKANLTGNCSGSSGSCTGNAATATTATTAEACTGNAATATKLATARTIALSGAATGTATDFDGSGNITIPVTALSGSAITSAITIYDLVPDGAASHRNFYRGKDITAAFNNGTVSANIANGTFRDIFPGDYITKQITVPQILKADGTTEYIAQTAYNVRFIIADLDVWLNRGYEHPGITAHHVAIVPQSAVFNSVMNETNVTTGGYLGSFMNTNVMPAFATGLQNAFGSAHMLQFRFFDTKAVNNELKSGGIVNFTGATYWGGYDWASHYCRLMTETMVYGAPITASCAADEIMGGGQFAAFRLNSNLVYNRQNYWLSDVVSSAIFACVFGTGHAHADNASLVYGVRPFALLK